MSPIYRNSFKSIRFEFETGNLVLENKPLVFD